MVLLSDISIDTLTKVGIVAAVFCGLALLLAILILVISRVCKIETDEKLEKVLEKLAGANCGGCGCSGCAGFAEKLCKGESSLSDCHVTSPESKQEIAEILGVEEVKKKWGLQSPLQVIDMLGLMGDAVDNIPGCPGVGEKTAQKFIAEFGSIENLLASTSKLKGALS